MVRIAPANSDDQTRLDVPVLTLYPVARRTGIGTPPNLRGGSRRKCLTDSAVERAATIDTLEHASKDLELSTEFGGYVSHTIADSKSWVTAPRSANKPHLRPARHGVVQLSLPT